VVSRRSAESYNHLYPALLPFLMPVAFATSCAYCLSRFAAEMSSGYLTHLRALPAFSTCPPPVSACLSYLSVTCNLPMSMPLPSPINQRAYPLSNYSITLALPAFYSPYRALYFTLRVSLISIVHMLWLPSLPALP
jgi:hypothetical protein